jgi:hypothetical protein
VLAYFQPSLLLRYLLLLKRSLSRLRACPLPHFTSPRCSYSASTPEMTLSRLRACLIYTFTHSPLCYVLHGAGKYTNKCFERVGQNRSDSMPLTATHPPLPFVSMCPHHLSSASSSSSSCVHLSSASPKQRELLTCCIFEALQLE